MISTLQLKEGLACDESTLVVIPLELLEAPVETFPKDILSVLEKYSDLMPDSF